MEKSDPFSLRADAWNLVDELNPSLAAALERCVEVVHRKADVVYPRPPFRHEARDRRSGIVRFQQLHQSLARAEASYPGAIRVIELHLVQSKHIAKKRQAFPEGLDGDADM